MKKHYEMLDALIETGHADKIRIKYPTNLTETKAGKHNLFKYIPTATCYYCCISRWSWSSD